MPWPMVHVRIAEQLCNGAPSSELLIGSIAPDAIHMRGRITREEKNATHLVHKHQLASDELILQTMNHYLRQRSEPEWHDFVVGYFCHIYTDVRWTHTLYAAFENEFVDSSHLIRTRYNQEVSQLEFALMASDQNTAELLERLSQANGYAIVPFVTKQEVQSYREAKLTWLFEPSNEPGVTLDYFGVEKVNCFITDTAMEWKVLIGNVWTGGDRAVQA